MPLVILHRLVPQLLVHWQRSKAREKQQFLKFLHEIIRKTNQHLPKGIEAMKRIKGPPDTGKTDSRREALLTTAVMKRRRVGKESVSNRK